MSKFDNNSCSYEYHIAAIDHNIDIATAHTQIIHAAFVTEQGQLRTQEAIYNVLAIYTSC